MPSKTQEIHHVDHLDEPGLGIVYPTHSGVDTLVFCVLLLARMFPIGLGIVKTRLLSIARDKTVGPTVDPSELLGPACTSLL